MGQKHLEEALGDTHKPEAISPRCRLLWNVFCFFVKSSLIALIQKSTCVHSTSRRPPKLSPTYFCRRPEAMSLAAWLNRCHDHLRLRFLCGPEDHSISWRHLYRENAVSIICHADALGCGPLPVSQLRINFDTAFDTVCISFNRDPFRFAFFTASTHQIGAFATELMKLNNQVFGTAGKTLRRPFQLWNIISCIAVAPCKGVSITGNASASE